LDTHAIPRYGYQHLLRFLGNHEALPPLPVENTQPIPGNLPALPAVPDDEGWQPFVHEGSPAKIAALVRYQLRMSGRKDWYLLENALRWLDRLCLHQRLCEVPGGGNYGGFGEGAVWKIVKLWMPHLLLDAFRLTGNSEYAYRGMAAFSALPPRHQAIVLAKLHPEFGDIFISADQGDAIFFTPLSHFHSQMTQNGIILEFADSNRLQPLHLVMEGSQESYQVEVNGKSLGFLPTSQLRKGIELPAYCQPA
jgi:hypothetical protein